MSNGHSYLDIMDEYTPGMIRKFYRACLIQKQERLLDDASAARFGQATDKSWRTINRDIRRSIDSLLDKAMPKRAEAVRRGDADFNQFLGMVTTDKKGKSQTLTRKDIKNAGS